MTNKTFESVESLKEFLNERGLPDSVFFVHPDYVRAVIGISVDGRVVYDYDRMVEDLAEQYRENDEDEEMDGEDYYNMAVEWIDYNVYTYGKDFPIVVITKDEIYEGYDYFLGVDGIDEALIPYTDAIIGVSNDFDIIFDVEKLNDNQMEEISEILGKADFGYIWV